MDYSLRPYQKRVGELILKGKNVILQAPTGAGKTYAALNPFSYALREGVKFPGKCIYAVPMRVLANQFVEKYQDMIKPIDLLDRRTEALVSIQTGEHRNDPTLESVLTFCTIDQVLSSFLIAPYGLSRRLGNINAGAVVTSYIVVDEVHLLDHESTLPTTLEMLRMLNGVVPFILMTATFTTTLLGELAQLLDAEVVGGNEEEIKEFASLSSQQKARRYHTAEAPLSAAPVIERHRGQTLVICNQVERAQATFERIRDAAREHLPNTRTLLLHSRLLQEDRAIVEATTREALSEENYRNADVIIVATQVIEVGLDINSTVLHTELAPANSIVQRAGRCARYANTEGDVYVYRYTLDETGTPIDLIEDPLPYKDQEEVIARTWEALSGSQGALDYAGEHRILNYAHSEQDKLLCEKLRSDSRTHRREMIEVMAGREPGNESRLIRDIYTQRVLIHAQPDALLDPKRAPHALEGFNLQPGTVSKYAKEWLERNLPDEPPFRIKRLIEQPNPEQVNRFLYDWMNVSDPKDIKGAAIIVVHPDLAGYDPVLGFLPHRGNGYMTPVPTKEPSNWADRTPGYQLETYERHIELVYEQFRLIWPTMERTAAKLEKRYGWPAGSINHAARLAITLHDTGKLNTDWQRWVWDWQRFIGQIGTLSEGRAYAHTDLNTPQQQQLSREFKGKRPPHAGEGAIAVLRILYEALCDAQGEPIEPLISATFTAIATHHTPHISNVEPFSLMPSARDYTQRLLRHYVPELRLPPLHFPTVAEQKTIQLDEYLACPNEDLYSEKQKAFLIYTMLVRALRLADQKGTEAGTFRG